MVLASAQPPWYLELLHQERGLLLSLGAGFLGTSIMLYQARRMAKQAKGEFDPKATDAPLLGRFSEIKCYSTSRFRYHDLRVFFRQHQQADQLPQDPAPLPLLVFVHGLGGSVAQFAPLLTSLSPLASCLAIDLPGCGRSDFNVGDWDAYSTDALVELLNVVIEDYRQKDVGQGVVLVGHSMGCSLAALVANPRKTESGVAARANLSDSVMGLVAICPSAIPPTEKQVRLFRKLLWIPGPIFDLWRAWDRRGGTESASVRRWVGDDADPEAKHLQQLFNNQSRTPVWRRMAYGALPVYENGVPHGGIPDRETWAGLSMPVFLVGGECDHATPPKNVHMIVQYLEGKRTTTDGGDPGTEETDGLVDSAAPVAVYVRDGPAESIESIDEHDFSRNKAALDVDNLDDDPVTPIDRPPTPPQLMHPPKVVETKIFSKPAGHALLYTPSTCRILAGLICTFLETRITKRLSLTWQLQYLSRDGKWDVKNLEKWKKVQPVSEPIAGVFRAMKTLRGVDETHRPEVFAAKWSSEIKDMIDISHDNPVYDPEQLERAGIRYHKFPTVSKVPPTDAEVEGFIDLVDKIRKESKTLGDMSTSLVGVHCHYGFNRTGYFIVCYLVERCGYGVGEAIELFAQCRKMGIKHEHFKNQLHVRYSAGGAGR